MNQTDGVRGERDFTDIHPEISSTETRQFPPPSTRPSFFSSFILHPSSFSSFIPHPSSFFFILSAFLLRLGVRLARGEAGFWEGSYDFYFVLARKIVAEHSFCYDATTCAYWTPGYPLFLALATWGTRAFVALAVAQSLVGAGTCYCVFKLAERWFDRRAGLLAGWLCAVYPYFVVHDTALQETSLFTFLVALGTWLLVKDSPPLRSGCGFAGAVFGAAVLVRPTILPFVILAGVWLCFRGDLNLKPRLAGAAVFSLAFGLMVAPWMLRNQFVVGRFVLGIRTGHSLWIGNNPDTFSHYPTGSIDRSTDAARARWTAAEQAEFARVSKSETAQDDWYFQRAVSFIKTHPGETVVGAVRKNLAGFSWRLNPAKGLAEQLVYGFSYGPVLLLALVGAWRLRKDRATLGLLAAHGLSFAAITAVFWAHTSHRSYLDVTFIALAAGIFSGPAFRKNTTDTE